MTTVALPLNPPPRMVNRRSFGKRGRTIQIAVPAGTRLARPDRDDFTPEYHEARTYEAFVQNVSRKYSDAEMTPDVQRGLIQAREAVQAEEEL